MLHYDIWQNAGGFSSLEESIRSIGNNKILADEIIEVMEILIDKVDFLETEITLPYSQPLKIHGRYTREQILVRLCQVAQVCRIESKCALTMSS